MLLVQYVSAIKVTKLHHLLLDPLLTECSKRQSMEVDESIALSFMPRIQSVLLEVETSEHSKLICCATRWSRSH